MAKGYNNTSGDAVPESKRPGQAPSMSPRSGPNLHPTTNRQGAGSIEWKGFRDTRTDTSDRTQSAR